MPNVWNVKSSVELRSQIRTVAPYSRIDWGKQPSKGKWYYQDKDGRVRVGFTFDQIANMAAFDVIMGEE